MNTIPRTSGSRKPDSFHAASHQVCAVVLAFGDRVSCLEHVLSRLSEMELGQILVVRNGHSAPIDGVMRKWSASHAHIEVLELEENGGSAGGYRAGLDHALHAWPACELFWLLDDDNLPEPAALDELLHVYNERAHLEETGGPVVVAYRPDQGSYVQLLVTGTPWQHVFVTPSSFLSFHLVDSVSRMWRRLKTALKRIVFRTTRARSMLDVVETPLIYYGGMLLPRMVLEKSGLPKPELFIYGDDSEFSFRLDTVTKILVVSRAVIQDLEASWYVATRGNRYVRLMTTDSDMRIYYQVRNNVWFQAHYMKRSDMMYQVNRCLVILLLRFLRLCSIGSGHRMQLIMRAIEDGEAARLGRVNDVVERNLNEPT